MNIALIISFIIIISSSFGGYRKGFFRTAIMMSSFIIAVLIASAISPAVTNYVKENTEIESTIKTALSDFLEGAGEEELEEKYFADFNDGLGLPQAWEQALDQLPTAALYEQLGVDDIIDYYVDRYTSMAVQSISYVLSVAIAYLLIRIGLGIADMIGYIPILSGLNRLAWLVLWLARLFIILLLAGLVIALCSGYEWTGPVLDMIRESALLTFLYRNNLLARLILPIASSLF